MRSVRIYAENSLLSCFLSGLSVLSGKNVVPKFDGIRARARGLVWVEIGRAHV